MRKNIFSLFDRYIIEQLSIHEFICLKFDPNLVTKAVSYKLHKKWHCKDGRNADDDSNINNDNDKSKRYVTMINEIWLREMYDAEMRYCEMSLRTSQ